MFRGLTKHMFLWNTHGLLTPVIFKTHWVSEDIFSCTCQKPDSTGLKQRTKLDPWIYFTKKVVIGGGWKLEWGPQILKWQLHEFVALSYSVVFSFVLASFLGIFSLWGGRMAIQNTSFQFSNQSLIGPNWPVCLFLTNHCCYGDGIHWLAIPNLFPYMESFWEVNDSPYLTSFPSVE